MIIVGGGGIGHDVALFVALGEDGKRQTAKAFGERWGLNGARKPHPPRRQVTMVKRSAGPFGRTLGKSTG